MVPWIWTHSLGCEEKPVRHCQTINQSLSFSMFKLLSACTSLVLIFHHHWSESVSSIVFLLIWFPLWSTMYSSLSNNYLHITTMSRCLCQWGMDHFVCPKKGIVKVFDADRCPNGQVVSGCFLNPCTQLRPNEAAWNILGLFSWLMIRFITGSQHEVTYWCDSSRDYVKQSGKPSKGHSATSRFLDHLQHHWKTKTTVLSFPGPLQLQKWFYSTQLKSLQLFVVHPIPEECFTWSICRYT